MIALDSSMPTERHVAYSKCKLGGADYRVSTVDLFYGNAPGLPAARHPYETLVFVGDAWGEVYGERYATVEEATEGHQRIVSALLGGTLEMY